MKVKTLEKQKPAARRRVKRATNKKEDIYNLIFNAYMDAVILADNDGLIRMVNPVAEKFFNLTAGDMVGRKMQRLCEVNGSSEVNILRSGKDSGIAEIRCVEIKGSNGESLYMSNLRDITEMVRLREELNALSLLDDDVNLCNRKGFYILAQQQVKLVERTKKGLYLLLISIDNYKQVSEKNSQQGKQLIKLFAEILKQTFRKTDIIARISEDTFAVLALEAQTGTNDIMAGHLLFHLKQYNELAKTDSDKLLASMGSAYLKPESGLSLDGLIQQADSSLYKQRRGQRESALLWYIGQNVRPRNN